MRNLADLRAKRNKNRIANRDSLISSRIQTFNLTDEEIAKCREEDGYNTFIAPLSKIALERAFTNN